ncbi:acyl-CoA carboxylase subunit epsilon [Actinomycetes bacterium M1A6_2h]
MTAVEDRSKSTGDDITIVSGSPTDDEIAALIAVIVAARSASDRSVPDSGPRDLWGRPADQLRSGTTFAPFAFGVGTP